ncbi:MAG: hypothetical protein PUI50_05465 [Firmicutes bacterium]|nr:hypothetical protein [Bacillota bacterium]
MGDRAVIANKDKNIGVYLHWDGYREFVESILAYCDVKGYRSPDADYEYGWARLCQVAGNTIGGTLSLGVGVYSRMDTDNWDNGTYIIKDWDIVERLYQHYEDAKMQDSMFENLVYINNKQPKDERLPEEDLEKYADSWEEKHLERLNDERRKIVDERIKAKEEMEILQKEKSQEQKIQELQVSKENKQKSENKAKEKNSTISDKDGENSTKVKEPIIPYSVLKDNGITFNLDKGDDR